MPLRPLRLLRSSSHVLATVFLTFYLATLTSGKPRGGVFFLLAIFIG